MTDQRKGNAFTQITFSKLNQDWELSWGWWRQTKDGIEYRFVIGRTAWRTLEAAQKQARMTMTLIPEERPE